jgi:hypothetical protein
MGIADKERRAIHVEETTWRKAKILAAAFGVPIYAIVTQALDEMAENHKEQVVIALKEVRDEQVQGRAGAKRRNPRG